MDMSFGDIDFAMQVIASLAASTSGLAPSWSNLEAWQKVSVLTKKYLAQKADADKFESQFGTHLDELRAHRTRLERAVTRLQEVVEHNREQAEEDPDAIQDIQDTLEVFASLSTAVDVCSDQIVMLDRQRMMNKGEVQETLTALLQQLENMGDEEDDVEELPETIEKPELNEDMYLPHELESLEAQLDEFDQQKYAGHQDRESLFFQDPEIARREQEELNFQLTFNDLKIRQSKLKSSQRSVEEEQEIAEVELQIQELGHQLALLGVPIKDGSVVRLYGDTWEYGSGASPIQRVQYDEQPEVGEMAPQVNNKSTIPDAPRHGLFDGADIEKPNASMEGNETPLTRAQIESMSAKLLAKVGRWLDDIDDTVGPEDAAALPLNRELDDSLKDLGLLDQNDSITRIVAPMLLSEWDQAIIESRRRAWVVQLARDRKQTMQKIKAESPEIERSPEFQGWLE